MSEQQTDAVSQVDSGVSDRLAAVVFVVIAAFGIGGLLYSHFFLGGVTI
jgi:hypothetical protein